MDEDGDFVVVWASYGGQDGDAWGIFAQRFFATGAPRGGEFQVNTFTTGDQQFPVVAMDADGDFVVAWRSLSTPTTASGYDVFAQRFDAAGVPQGSEFRVNAVTTGDQESPAVAMDADGDFVVVWGDYTGLDGSNWGVFAQRYDAAGTAQGPNFQVNTLTDLSQRYPAVAMDADGDFVVAWQSRYRDGAGWGVFARRYDAGGVTQGPEFQVNDFTMGNQGDPAVAMAASGDFVVAWTSDNQDSNGSGVFAQRFDTAGTLQGPEFQVNTTATSNQWQPAVAMDADGDFVVTWSDNYSIDVFAQCYDAAGVVQGPEFRVNTFTGGTQWYPAVAMDAGGDFVVAWESSHEGSGYGVFGQRFQGDGPVPDAVDGDFDGDGNADILWRNTSTGDTLLWQMNGFAKQATGSIGTLHTDWQVRGLADFNADTRTDVLWRNTVTGETVVWLMDGFTTLAAGEIGLESLDWQIIGTGDFDGNRRADILWRNTSNGAVVMWLMDGFTKLASDRIGGEPLAWEVVGVGEFDGDGNLDILWNRNDRRSVVIWFMDGFSKIDSGRAGDMPRISFQMAGVGDFDTDGKSDILWRDTNGRIIIWQMNGLTWSKKWVGRQEPVWRVERLGDTDGDRLADIIWRNTDTETTVIWKMVGYVKNDSASIGQMPLVWEVQ